MTTTLRIARVPDEDSATAAPVKAPPMTEAVPLMRRDIEQETDEGKRVDRIIMWRNQDGARCNWCPAESCTFAPGPDGQGFCILRSQVVQARLGLPALPRSG